VVGAGIRVVVREKGPRERVVDFAAIAGVEIELDVGIVAVAEVDAARRPGADRESAVTEGVIRAALQRRVLRALAPTAEVVVAHRSPGRTELSLGNAAKAKEAGHERQGSYRFHCLLQGLKGPSAKAKGVPYMPPTA